jgi:hypothetical protein
VTDLKAGCTGAHADNRPRKFVTEDTREWHLTLLAISQFDTLIRYKLDVASTNCGCFDFEEKSSKGCDRIWHDLHLHALICTSVNCRFHW